MVARCHADMGVGRGSILRNILQRFEAAEVHRSLYVLAEPPDTVRIDHDRNRRLVGLRSQRRDQPAVRQQRRVNPPGQIAKVAERTRGIFLQLA